MTSRPDHDRLLIDRLDSILATRDDAALAGLMRGMPPLTARRLLSKLDAGARRELVVLLSPAMAADLVTDVPEVQAAGLIQDLEPSTAAAILENLPSNEQADLLGDLEDDRAEAILGALEPSQARIARRLSAYPDDTAGGLMHSEYLVYPAAATVAHVVQDLRDNAERYRDFDVQYVYVTGERGRLRGVLRLRDLLLAPGTQSTRDVMLPEPVTVRDDATLDELRAVLDSKTYRALPVVDQDRRLLGIVRRADVRQAEVGRMANAYLKSQGIVGGEEIRSMPLALRSRRRLSWLTINIVLNVIAASVIALHQDTIAAVVVLAVFIPIISDMSGCSGSQAVAVSIRELTLGLVRPREVLRVWAREVSVGTINGLALGTLIGAIAWAWKGNPVLALVVGSALAINTVIAVSIGGAVPLLLRRMGIDPALAAGPVLTTITDLCGFLLLLGLAGAVLPKLAG
jgi:magnesium transporter